jgi:hypothetical protein
LGPKPTEIKDIGFNWAINPLFIKNNKKRKKRFHMLAQLDLQTKLPTSQTSNEQSSKPPPKPSTKMRIASRLQALDTTRRLC